MPQHDYVISDDTGANVRADLNNVLQAILSANSGSSAPSATAPGQLWYDTANGLLKVRNAADSGWNTLFSIAGVPYSEGNTLTIGTEIGDIVQLADLGDTANTPTLPAVDGSQLTGLNVANAPALGTEQDTSSGTSWEWTSIPSWVTQIDINFAGFSVDASTSAILQIGSGSYETSSYDSSWIAVSSSAVGGGGNAVTSGFNPMDTVAASTFTGTVTLTLEDSANNTWIMKGNVHREDQNSHYFSAGRKSIGGTLDRLKLTTTGGDNGDAGAVNIRYS